MEVIVFAGIFAFITVPKRGSREPARLCAANPLFTMEPSARAFRRLLANIGRGAGVKCERFYRFLKSSMRGSVSTKSDPQSRAGVSAFVEFVCNQIQ
jgi:hypothetical protein